MGNKKAGPFAVGVGSQYPQVLLCYFLLCFLSTLTWTFCLPTAIWLSIIMRTARDTRTINREAGVISRQAPIKELLKRFYGLLLDLSRAKCSKTINYVDIGESIELICLISVIYSIICRKRKQFLGVYMKGFPYTFVQEIHVRLCQNEM